MKNTIWFFSLETLGHMHKNIFFLFFKFFCILKVLTKTRYFNTGFLFLWCKIQTDIKQKKVEKYMEKLNFSKAFLRFFFWLGPDPTQTFWVRPDLPAHVNSVSLHYSHATWTVARPEEEEEEEEEREREEGLHVVAHGASGDRGGGRTQLVAAAGGTVARCFSFFFLCAEARASVFFLFFFCSTSCC